MKKLYYLFISIFLVTACASPNPILKTTPLKITSPNHSVTNPVKSTPPPQQEISVTPLQPKSGHVDIQRGNAFIHEADLLIRESYPPQIVLVLSGDLPTPCNQLQVDLSSPDSENRIFADVYSVTNTDKVCIQVIKPFEENIEMGTFPAGHYSVFLNGELIGEFDS